MSTYNEEVIEIDCWGHLINVWLGGMTKEISNFLNMMLDEELEAIDSHLIVSTGVDAILSVFDN